MNSQKVGYWLPVEQSLRLSRNTQNNKNWLNTATVSGIFATAWINHGKGPKNATYSYFMRINTTKSDMNDFDIQMQGSAPPFTILALTDKIHAVESVSNNTYSAAVINAGTSINLKDVISVSKPCLFMMKTLSTSQMKLSMSYTDLDFIDNGLYTEQTWWGYSNPNTVQISLKGNWYLVTPVSQNVSVISRLNNVTILQFILKDGLTTDALISKDITTIAITKNELNPRVIVNANEISIALPENGWSNTTCQILSLDGKSIRALVLGKSINKISTANFMHGVYLIRLKDDNQTFTQKVII
jgi:hypothetical protein